MRQRKIVIFAFMVFIISMPACWSIQLIKSVRSLALINYASAPSLSIANIEFFISWGRNPETDLPRHFCSLNFKIQSSVEGTGVLTVVIDGSSGLKEFMLKSGTTSVGGFLLISDYNDFGRTYFLKTYLTVRTSSIFLYTYKEFFLSSPKLPRYLDENVARLYITPRNPTIKNLVASISGWPRWLALLNWVSQNIAYRYDHETYGVIDYWQLPTETLQLRTGDCEDYAILLCTLYRAAGYDENSAFVILGCAKDGDHAWVRIYAEMYGIGTWINIEPQIGGLFGIIHGMLDTTKYDEVYQFNDVYFTKLK